MTRYKFKEKVPLVAQAEFRLKYRGYGIYEHPLYGFSVCQMSPYDLKARNLTSLKEAQAVIDGLPPPADNLWRTARR